MYDISDFSDIGDAEPLISPVFMRVFSLATDVGFGFENSTSTRQKPTSAPKNPTLAIEKRQRPQLRA
jgi:hypothetical protein